MAFIKDRRVGVANTGAYSFFTCTAQASVSGVQKFLKSQANIVGNRD